MAESIDDVRGAPGEMSGIEDAELLAILGRLAAAEPTEGLIAAVGSETLGVSFEGWDKNVVLERRRSLVRLEALLKRWKATVLK